MMESSTRGGRPQVGITAGANETASQLRARRDRSDAPRSHWYPSAGVAACLVVAGSVLAACGGASGSASPSTTERPVQSSSSTSSTPASTSTSTTTSATAAAVLAAYRAEWRAFEQALAGANPEDPELAATMVPPQLTGVRANLTVDRRKGMVGRGSFTLHPKLVSLSATTATVVDCAYSTSVLVYAKTGKPVPPITPPENDGVSSELVQTGGAWKVYKQTVTEGKCTPGS